jgi:cytochrome c oxidase subunit II
MMLSDLPMFPERVSTVAASVDALYLFLVSISGFISVLIFVLILYFGIKYRRRPDNEIPQEGEPGPVLEATWIIVPFLIFMATFVWGAAIYFRQSREPDDALDIYITAKQWMWKAQHPSGQREINTLHVPVNRPIRLTMASEDVIHAFYVPAFRVQADVLPNRYRKTWFQATKVGRYHWFCAQYCGTAHSQMIGWIEVMEPSAYQNWLAGGAEGSLASQGEILFRKYACNTCHTNEATGRGPVLAGLYNAPVQLSDGSVVTADDNYIRESITNSQAKIVKGFQPIMPLFQGQISEEDLLKLVAYIKSLTVPAPATAPAGRPGERKTR